jgi:hypothetical protein
LVEKKVNGSASVPHRATGICSRRELAKAKILTQRRKGAKNPETAIKAILFLELFANATELREWQLSPFRISSRLCAFASKV